MKKISTLLMLFCAFVCTAWAAPTDFPVMSEGENITWYTLSNTRSASGKYLYWTAEGVKDSNERTAASFFYFTGTADACYIHNYSTNLLLSGTGAWTAAGVPCKLSVSPLETGFMIGFSDGNYLNEQNFGNGYTTYWKVDDEGSIFVVEEITDFSAIIDVPAAKTAAIAEVKNYAVVSSIYPAATSSTEAAINAVTPENNSIAGLNAAIEAINAKVIEYKKSAYEALSGKYFSIETPARDNGFMEMATSKVLGAATLASPAGIWQFVSNNDGTLKVFNPYTGKYLCEPQGNSAEVAVTTDANSAGNYTLEVNNTNPAAADAKIKFTSNGKSVHMDGSFNLVRWDNGGASEWAVIEVADYSAIIDAHKNTTIATLDQWATLSVVFDADLIAAAKTSVNSIEANGFATFAAIDAQLTTVTNKVAQKYFTFKNTDTKTAARVDAYLAANVASTPKKGYGTKTLDYSSIWRLLSAGGTSFYLYNELNGLYLKNPSSGELVENASDAGVYTFEIVDAATNKAELKCEGQTLHLSNACALMSYDENDPASRWIIAEFDFKEELRTLVEENASNHAPVPALRQYPTEAYEALVAANETATSVAEVSAAVAAFKASKNLPVFTISGTKDYVFGKSIYDNNSGSLYFKATNNYDKSMLWAFDQTTTTVGVTEKVVVTNVGTGKNFWGAPSVKITETKEAIADDGIFLLYTEGNGTTVHFQDANQIMVRYNSTEANSGSAMTFTYIGSTYELAQLTDEKWAALAELEALYNANKDALVGEGLGKYTCNDYEWWLSFDYAISQAEGIVTNLSEKITTSLNTINDLNDKLREASTMLQINLPVAGKYYRFQGACEASLPGYYITGHTNGDGGRIALTEYADASTIYYFDGANLIAYQSGLVVGLNASHWTFASVDDNSKPASVITFTGSPVKGGAYSINSAGRYFHYTVYNGTVQVNRCSEDVCQEHAWYITEVTELPVTISDAGYSSFYAPVEVTLPAGVTAHTVTENNGEWATLSEAISVVPAENGVILAGEAGTYNLTVSNTSAADLEGALAGTVAKTLVTKADGAYYVLGVKDEVVGLYNPVIGEDNTKFYNAGHKAYWYIPAGTQTAGFRFGGNTTAIESVLNGVDANAPIYDLSGRRVNNAVKGGIYIKNGKKFIVK